MKRISIGIAAALAIACATVGWAQQTIEMKLAYCVGDHYTMSQWLIKWGYAQDG